MAQAEVAQVETRPPFVAEQNWGIATRIVDSGCRYFIALLMLVYGLVKVFQGQFYTDEYWRDTALRNLDGCSWPGRFTVTRLITRVF
ncbi:MAG TPA: hypothetical protein VGP63_06935 [Planctomycetaceae bacterium]|jgi:hypothetical protein|nr:hypothetical protein [Planctomycetaceae bacterium]